MFAVAFECFLLWSFGRWQWRQSQTRLLRGSIVVCIAYTRGFKKTMAFQPRVIKQMPGCTTPLNL